MIGTQINGRFRLDEKIGTGGMSTVYRAFDPTLERWVAIKLMHRDISSDPDQLERFRREARTVAQLNHPHVVTVIDAGEDDGAPYIVFEYVEGETLKERIRRLGSLPVPEAVAYAIEIGRGLAAAHARRLVHRDVKPQNILIDADGRAKVTDFGIARSLDVQQGMTQSGTVMGTSDYIAPEQARGERVDEQTDVYSLGVVLYELLTGEVPFPGENFVAVAMRHINEPPPSARERRPDVSPRLDAAIKRAMAKEPEDRFGSMGDFVGELEAALEVGPDEDTGTIVLPGRPRRRRRVLRPLLLLLLALAVLGAIVGGAYLVKRSSDHKSGGAAHPRAVHLRAIATYDPPPGDGHEHDETRARATDGNPNTFWTTEHYDNGLQKPGVGLLLDAGGTRAPKTVTVTSDTPGFTAVIKAGSSSSAPFMQVSGARVVGRQTTFRIRGKPARFYLIWITDLGDLSVAHVNEVRAGT